MTLRNVAVYCSASADVDSVFLDTAHAMGVAIARAGWGLVYGGNRTGCMHEVAEGARSAGGRVIGVTPQLFVDRGIQDTAATELVITAGMRERKREMEHRADAFVVLPGGLGTYEELFEQLVNRQLKYHDKPIVALNIRGSFTPLAKMLDHGIDEGFIKPKARQLIEYAETVEGVIDRLKAARHVVATAADMSHEVDGIVR